LKKILERPYPLKVLFCEGQEVVAPATGRTTPPGGILPCKTLPLR
jgi:hypothetical protein